MLKKIQNNRGFTLLEVVVVLAIVAILAGVGTFSVVNYRPAYRLREAARELASTIQNARFEAIQRNASCAVSYNVPGTSYLSFVDNNQNFQFDAGDVQLTAVQLANYEYVSYVAGGLTFPNNGVGNPTVAFNNRGLPIYNGGGVGAFWATVQSTQGTQRQIRVSTAGNVRIQ